jgi:ATP-dependent RNA helicase DeaD
MQRFDQMNLHPVTLRALQKMGFETATPIQAQAIPALFEGRDVIAQARTGTGKTAAFGIPLIEGCAGDGDPGVLALVLVPTRELALQVTEELTKLAHGTAVRAVAVYGGVGFDAQVKALRGRHTVALVATPGRLLDHLQRGTVRLDTVRMLVLDEADRMLDMGFLPDVERILKNLPRQRQTCLFSATVPEPIRRLSARFLHNPASFKAEDGPAPAPLVEQFHLQVPQAQKAPALHRLLEREAPQRAIVFTRTKHRARSVARVLSRNGWEAVALQGNMTQSQRERALAAFRSGDAKILVATDVASRGLDIPDVSHVVNLDLPDEPEAYVHRIGRTARMGRSGRAFTFVQPAEARDLQRIASNLGVQIPQDGLDLSGLPVLVAPAPAPPEGNGRGRGPRHGGRYGGRPQRRRHAA